MEEKKSFFAPVSSRINLPKREREILKWWDKNDIVQAYLHQNDSSEKKFRFLDGPITANNPMGVHHAHGRTLKDFFQRYKNMRGFKQRFQNGFDCQGLWVEVEEEKDRGFNSKQEIEQFGLERFSCACRERVKKYAAIQTEQSKRLGMFMDWDNSYFTMSEENNLYIWYFLKVCFQRGWLYEGTDSMPWCIRCGTAISQHELSDEGYREVEHDAVYVKFPLKGQEANLLIWTTTPWTLLANVAVAIKPDLVYVEVESEGARLIVAQSRLGVLKAKHKVLKEFRGEELVGKTYQGPFDELPKLKNVSHRVIPWDEVSEAEGTGLVHIAPGAGHEDFELGKIHRLDLVTALDEFGFYEKGFGSYSRLNVREVLEKTIKELEQKGLLYNQEKIVHSYPFCWRCKEELIFRTTSEWFIKVEEIRPLMKKAAATVAWIPDYAHKRMQDWLDNMGDWPISRKRYWGLALPFWECPCGELIVVGSREELREKAIDPKMVDQLPELHRPWIDAIKLKCPRCGDEASRVLAVGDCWLDAGIVPFSTIKYLEDRDYWKQWYPFDFITEYLPQIKLWFYTTLLMSVVLENKAPWRRVLATGLLVDEKGETMHKSKGNAIWFGDAVEEMGADVMRWIYLSKDLFGKIRFGFNIGNEVRRRLHMILWNSQVFFITFANLDGWTPKSRLETTQLSLLDRWILSRLQSTIKVVTEAGETYSPPAGARAIETLVRDLSTWYVRRSRERVGPVAKEGSKKEAFFITMYEVLLSLCKIMAPYNPFFSEMIYQNLRSPDDPQSIHLCSWPKVKKKLIDHQLEKVMEITRQAAELGHAARHQAGVKVRQPLASIAITLLGAKKVKDQAFLTLLAEELNVKKIKLREGETGVKLDTKITPELKQEGEARELFRQLQELRRSFGCSRDERLKQVILPDINLKNKWLDWVKENILADEIKLGQQTRIMRYG
jgi:isoleucyl-tRNA synthetase